MRAKKIIHHPAGELDTSRRTFLRRAGLASAMAAALAGGAELVGVTTASAASRQRTDACPCPAGCVMMSCKCAGVSHAGSNGCCDPGYCCYHCTFPSHCGGGTFRMCFTRSASNNCASGFNHC